jgi:hypothetical protein
MSVKWFSCSLWCRCLSHDSLELLVVHVQQFWHLSGRQFWTHGAHEWLSAESINPYKLKLVQIIFRIQSILQRKQFSIRSTFKSIFRINPCLHWESYRIRKYKIQSSHTHSFSLSLYRSWNVLQGLIAGVLCNFSKNDGVIPVNKNLWSLSFVLGLASMAFLLQGFLYLLVDAKRWWSGSPFYYAGKCDQKPYWEIWNKC